MSTPPPEADRSTSSGRALADVRRAAFELRRSDPAGAVRLLRRLVKDGGEIEPLAHGALGEILLEEFDDADGALHHFRRLVELAPELAAGHLGLARALARNGDIDAAQVAYATALAGLETLIAEARKATAGDLAGVDEAVLTALESAVEERRLCLRVLGQAHDGRSRRAPKTQPSAELADWAEGARLFDDPDDPADLDDWIAFARLRSELAVLSAVLPLSPSKGQDERAAGALAHIERIGRMVPLPPWVQGHLRSAVFETLGQLPAAAEEAQRAATDPDAPFDADGIVRCAQLLQAASRPADARNLLESAKRRLDSPVATARLRAEDRTAWLEEIERRLVGLGSTDLVSLGVGRRDL